MIILSFIATILCVSKHIGKQISTVIIGIELYWFKLEKCIDIYCKFGDPIVYDDDEFISKWH